MYAVLHREYQNAATKGHLSFWYDYTDRKIYPDPILSLCTLELPWRDNRSNISCIPEGTYLCYPRQSVKHKLHFELQNVKDRSLILFHQGNFTRDIEGCILVGMNHEDIDGDGVVDVVNSQIAMELLLRHGGFHRGGFLLNITS